MAESWKAIKTLYERNKHRCSIRRFPLFFSDGTVVHSTEICGRSGCYPGADLPYAYKSGSAVAFDENTVLFCCGLDWRGWGDLDIYKFDASFDTWDQLFMMPPAWLVTTRMGVADIGQSGRVLVLVGWTMMATEVWVRSLEGGTWVAKSPLPKYLETPSVFSMEGVFYVVGGDTGSGWSSEVHVYGAENDTWIPMGNYGAIDHIVGTVSATIWQKVSNDPLPDTLAGLDAIPLNERAEFEAEVLEAQVTEAGNQFRCDMIPF